MVVITVQRDTSTGAWDPCREKTVHAIKIRKVLKPFLNDSLRNSLSQQGAKKLDEKTIYSLVRRLHPSYGRARTREPAKKPSA